MTAHAAIARAVDEGNFLRRSSAAFSGQQGHKEWLHFAVHGDGVSLLLNFSVVDDTHDTACRGSATGRVTCLVHTDGWQGDVDTYSHGTFQARGGALSMRFGTQVVEFRDGAFHISVRLRRCPIAIELSLRPEALPSESHDVFFDDCPSMSWVVVPRLRAEGYVEVQGRRHTLDGAPAYHDHNWGYFRWGGNFVWEWGYGLPRREEDEFSLVFVRFMDRGRFSDLMRGILVWKGRRQARIFRGEDVRIRHEGLLAARNPYKLPKPMALVAPGSASDVPKRLVVEAESRGDRIAFSFEALDVAQIIAPNDGDLGVTIINEVTGELTADGVVGGERVHLAGRSTFEFLSD
jgi:hypothetical protein